MHFYALVEIPQDAENVKAAVEKAMEPYREGLSESGFWDWWQIGGRWTGTLDGYDPRADRRNMRECWLCDGSGLRDDEAARRWREKSPGYGCNDCDSTGIEVKCPTEWARHDGDIATRDAIVDERRPYTLVVGGEAYHREEWDGESYVDTSEDLQRAWDAMDPATRLVVVDYHA